MTSKKNKDDASTLDTLPITSLLKALGHEPISVTEEEYSYAGVFGDRPDNRIVLQVNHRLNLWFDKVLGKGGTLMDFVHTYWPNLSTEEIEQKLHDIMININTPVSEKDRPRRKRKAHKVPHYHIDRTHPLGHNTEITDFLKKSGLWELADLNIKEVYYFLTDQKGKRKDFCAAGWQNENSGWEVRAQHFEDCIGTKGMTFHSRSETTLAIFPVYEDYLKRRNDSHMPYASVLILNYPDFLSAAMKRASHFEKVFFYVDEAREGYGSVTDTLVRELPQATIISL